MESPKRQSAAESQARTPEKQRKAGALCLSPTDPSEDAEALAMASPVLTDRRSPSPPVSSPAMLKMPLPGLQYAISAHCRPSRELRLPSFSTSESACQPASFELETTPTVSKSETLKPEERVVEKQTTKPAAEKAARRKKGTRRGTLHPEAKNVLKAWMFSPEHFAHPYPSEEEKEELANEAGIEVKQLSNWFTNARKRLWQPVLRQSGVEVKNFLSTGRGGPRGNKLDVPVNLQHLVAPSPVPSPPGSPVSGSGTSSAPRSPLKRSWRAMQRPLAESSPSTVSTAGVDAPTSSASSKRRKSGTAVAKKRAKTNSSSSVRASHFHDLELLAATSLLGLRQQTQSVH